MSQVNATEGYIAPLTQFPAAGKIYNTSSTDFYQLLFGNSVTTMSKSTPKATRSSSDSTLFNLDAQLENYVLHEGIEPPTIEGFIDRQEMQRRYSPESHFQPPQPTKNGNGTAMTCSPEHRRGILCYIDMALMLTPPNSAVAS